MKITKHMEKEIDILQENIKKRCGKIITKQQLIREFIKTYPKAILTADVNISWDELHHYYPHGGSPRFDGVGIGETLHHIRHYVSQKTRKSKERKTICEAIDMMYSRY